MSRNRKRRRYVDCMVSHPESGRHLQSINRDVQHLVFEKCWIPNDGHPLGGYEGIVILKRRVNLVKDELPGYYRRRGTRPLYEFTREKK